jgi:hypothetical protein
MFQAGMVSDGPGLLARVRAWVKAHTRAGDDLAGFSRAEFGHMANDLGISEADLLALASSASDNKALMAGMMRARGLDSEVLRNSFLKLLRDAERVCALCRDTRRCQRELNAGTAVAHCHEFCANAGTFDDMIEYNMGR